MAASGKGLKRGDTLVVKVDPRSNNGSDEAVGMVLRVLDVEDGDSVNVRVFLDGDSDALLRNVPVLSSEPDEDDEDAPKQYALRS